MDPENTQNAPAAHPSRLTIEDASAWVLRIGVVVSVSVMLLGTILSFAHGTAVVDRMEHSSFDDRPSIIWKGVIHGHGKAIVELGIYLLVLTPILRVASSLVLFLSEDKDKLYAIITFFVLVLTLVGLLLLD